MDTYAQFCPIAKASEVITQRWMPLVLRELLCGSRRFNDIHRGLPRMSRSLLVKRLRELEDEGIVNRRLAGEDDHPEYCLTPSGEELRPIVVQLGVWGKRWIRREVSGDDLDAGLLMWDVQRRIKTDRLPKHRVLVRFRFPDAPGDRRDFYLLLDDAQADLCLTPPGHDENLAVESSLETFTRVWLGDRSLKQAIRNREVRLTGPAALRRDFPEWLGLSPFAAGG